MIKKRTSWNSTLRPQSPKREKEIADGTHKAKPRKQLQAKVSIEEARKKGKEVINRMLGEGKLKLASKVKEKPQGRLSGHGSLSSLMGQLDTVFSQVVRLRAVRECEHEGCFRCYICGYVFKYEESVLMHFEGRQGRGTRYNEMACKAGCYNCNNKPLGDRKNFAKRLNEEYGEGTSSRLTILSKQEMRYDREWYKEKIAYYTEEKKRLLK